MNKPFAAMPKYHVYKDSGVEWIGEVPEHWNMRKLKRLFYEKKHVANLNLNCGAISFGNVIKKDDEKIPLSTKKSYQEVMRGEFLVNPLNLNYDLKSLRIALSKTDVVVSAGYIVLKNYCTLDKGYFKYLLHRYDVAFMKLLGSGVRQTINFNHISNSFLTYPPLPEQTAIADFLDKKTSLIDEAVSVKEQQITLLKERKQILIQKAVTQGLNPTNTSGTYLNSGSADGPKGEGTDSPNNAPMRDSGVAWIGKIPVHWQIFYNRNLFEERVESGREGLPLLSVSIHSAVSNEEMADEDNIRGRVKIEDKSKYNLVQPDDVVYNMMRAWQGAIGAVRVEGMVSPAYTIAVPNELIDSSFFEYQYRSPIFIQQMDRHSKGITDFRKRLYWDEFKQLTTVVPPIDEQTAIVAHLETESTKIDKAIDLQQQQIEKIKEYKATLINSAVTGKIKVVDSSEGERA